MNLNRRPYMGFSGRMKMVFHAMPFFIILHMALLAGCTKEDQKSSSPQPAVSVMTVTTEDVPVASEYVAQTQSSQMVNIQARVSGFLEKRMYTEGAVVREGQVLFRMDDKPFKAQLAQAEAALARQEAALETARLNLARTRPLVEQNALSQRELDDADGQYQSAAAAVAQARAQVETEKLSLSYTTVTSPVTGVSSSARQSEGTYISPQNSLLTTVEVLSPIWVNFSLSENDLQRYRSQVDKGFLLPPEDHRYEVEIVLVDGSVFPYKGEITFAEPSYNPQTGTFLIRASVQNPDGLLHPNQYVRARLKGAIRPDAILIPQRAVQQDARGQFVWVIGQGNTAEKRPVVVGQWDGDQWFIQEGLKAGEQVVVDGSLMLQPGMKVKVKPDGSETGPAAAEGPKAEAEK